MSSRYAFKSASTATTLVIALSLAYPGCGGTPTCNDAGYCPGEDTAGTAGMPSGGDAASGAPSTGGSKGGTAGTSGKGGTTSGGKAGAGGSGADGGVGGAAGGEGGAPVVLPCDGACTGDKPVCKEATDTCVECLLPSDCKVGVETKCDTASNSCVECLASTDCKDAKLAKCDVGACAKCTSNDDCAHIAGKGVCDTQAGECVQCTGKNASACGMDQGTPLVCDSLLRTCTTKKEKSAGLCQACVSDQQCKAGQLCVKETFGAPAKDVGYFCFSKQSAVASADCTLPGNRPYVKTLANQTSVDGESADVCSLRASTCTARNQFSNKDCSTSTVADDQKCGFAPGVDSKCEAFGPSQFLCTMTCGGDVDCPAGFPCDTGANPPVCQL